MPSFPSSFSFQPSSFGTFQNGGIPQYPATTLGANTFSPVTNSLFSPMPTSSFSPGVTNDLQSNLLNSVVYQAASFYPTTMPLANIPATNLKSFVPLELPGSQVLNTAPVLPEAQPQAGQNVGDAATSPLVMIMQMLQGALGGKVKGGGDNGEIDLANLAGKPESPEKPDDKKPDEKKPDDANKPENQESKDTGKVTSNKVNGGGPNEMIIKNTDKKPMKIALFENLGPGLQPNLDKANYTYEVQPGETLKLEMPESWQGRAQRLSGNPMDPASWAEINYESKPESSGHTLWYNVSLIRGYNSAVTIKPTGDTDDKNLAGTTKSIIDGAPPDAVTTDAGGNKVIKDVETYQGGVNESSRNYLNKAIGEQTAYIVNDDHAAVRTSKKNSLTVTFGAP